MLVPTDDIQYKKSPGGNTLSIFQSILILWAIYLITSWLLFSASSERKKGSRKRKLMVDQSKELSNEAIKAQLVDCSDILITLDIAPPTRQLMDWKENGGVDYLFSHFCTPVMDSNLQKVTYTGFIDFWRFRQKMFRDLHFQICRSLNTRMVWLSC